MSQTVGVLGLQGDYSKHIQILKRLHVKTQIVRWPEDLASCDRLILPGGESTTFLNLMHKTGLFEAIREFSNSHPLFGTCAGSIVLSTQITHPVMQGLDLIDMRIERNAYGRQVNSFSDTVQIPVFEDPAFEAVFIRAPIIRSVGNETRILAQHNDEIILARNDRILVATFHPELTRDTRMHDYFLTEF